MSSGKAFASALLGSDAWWFRVWPIAEATTVLTPAGARCWDGGALGSGSSVPLSSDCGVPPRPLQSGNQVADKWRQGLGPGRPHGW